VDKRAVFAASGATGLVAVAAIAVLGLGGCGTRTMPREPGSAAEAGAFCHSAFVDWLEVSGGVKCDQATAVATAIFMGDDGNDRTSFMKDDFSPLPTVELAGVGYLPTRVLRAWHCRYSTRRSSYGVATAGPWLDASEPPRLVSATCRLGAGVVTMTTAVDQRANRRDA
jgi:hypothetical protein